MILTVSGADRAGLVKDLAACINANGGNWEESRMLHLGGRFVGMLDVRLAPDKTQQMREALSGLPGLEFTFAPAQQPAPEPELQCDLQLLGNDQLGIVRRITQLLQDRNVNVEELFTKTESAPESGAALFRMHARLGACADLDLDELQSALEALSDEIMVEATVRRLERD